MKFRPLVLTAILFCCCSRGQVRRKGDDDFLFNNCNKNPCNQLLQEFSREEIKTKAKLILQEQLGLLYPAIEPILNDMLRYGVKVYKICASCSEFQLEYNDNTCFQEFCGTDAYGYNATVSGLLFVPVDKLGALKGGIWSHTTSAHTCNDIPSEGGWSRFQSDRFGVDVIMPLLMATAGSAALAPDNLGYGESFDHHIGYVIRNQYKTSAVPLFLKAQHIIATESECETELSNSVALGGYSEGGFGSVAIAEALDTCLGVSILKLFSAAGPLQITTSFVEIINNIDLRSFPASRMHYVSLVGTAYSKRYPEYPLLADNWRVPLMNLTTIGSSGWSMINAIPAYPDDPLVTLNQDLITEVRASILEHGFEICLNQTLNKTIRTESFCQSLIENDVSDYLLNISYPFEVCHSPDDEVIPISNAIPLFQDHFFQSFGNHDDAATPCSLGVLEYFVDPEFLDAVPEISNHCMSSSPTASPSESTEKPSSPAVSGKKSKKGKMKKGG